MVKVISPFLGKREAREKENIDILSNFGIRRCRSAQKPLKQAV
jgi:hypothetical protein